MAAEVSSLLRVLNRYKDDDRTAAGEPSSSAPITRDFLGGDHHVNNNIVENQELDLDMQVPNGWEKRLDLKSGKVYLQRSSSQVASCPSYSSDHNQKQNYNEANETVTARLRLQDLNFPPSASSKSSKPKANCLLNLFDETRLGLKLVSSSSWPSGSAINQSVCTLDKVKSALERAKTIQNNNNNSNNKKRLSLLSLSPSYSSSSSSIRDHGDDDDNDEDASPMAVGCPGCLCYVLITKNDPKCRRCNSRVPIPAFKKPRIDLNISV